MMRLSAPLGVVCIAGAVGTMTTVAIGWVILGLGLVALGVLVIVRPSTRLKKTTVYVVYTTDKRGCQQVWSVDTDAAAAERSALSINGSVQQHILDVDAAESQK
jgi:hypothetical protein